MAVQCNTTPISTKSKSCKYLLHEEKTVDTYQNYYHNINGIKHTSAPHNLPRIYKEQLLYYLNLKCICKERVFHPLKVLMRKKPSSKLHSFNNIANKPNLVYKNCNSNFSLIRNKIAMKLKLAQHKAYHSHIDIH